MSCCSPRVFSLVFRTQAWIVVAVLALAMLVTGGLGLWVGKRVPGVREFDSTMEASAFALLGLVLAFTFSMAGTRYDQQRKLIVEEANAIGTAALRADLYREPERDGFRADFREYLEARIADYESHSDLARIGAARARSAAAQKLLWDRASRLAADSTNYVASLEMVPALNAMFDAAGRRYGAERARVPDSILYLLFAMCIVSTFLYTYLSGRSRRFERSAAVTFVILAVGVVYATLELDRPRRGPINVDASEQSLVELRTLF